MRIQSVLLLSFLSLTFSRANADGAPPPPVLPDALSASAALDDEALSPVSPSADPQVKAPKDGFDDATTGLKRLMESSHGGKTDDLLQSLVREVESLRSRTMISSALSEATQRPKASKRVGSKIHYSYKEGDVYEIHTGVDRITDVELQPGETLTNTPVAGDTVRWKIGIVKGGVLPKEVTHVIVKPLDYGNETNLFLTTNKHTYHLRVLSSDWYMPSVAWDYPLEEDEELAKAVRKEEAVEAIRIPPESLNFGYYLEGDNFEWKPLHVFDDGAKTYIQMPKSMRVAEAPALFVLEDENQMLVNYRVKGDYYIVDRLFGEAELRVGSEKTVKISDEAHRKNFFERLFD